MTTEVVVMNGQGVALAADSAVTLGSSKIFNTANKLYMLAPDYPVGILVYNNASFMNLPWEIVLNAYKQHITGQGIRLEKLEQYGENFVSFLKTNHEKFATVAQQELIMDEIAEGLFDEITKLIWRRLEETIFETSSKITDSNVKAETKAVIAETLKNLESGKDIYGEEDLKNFESSLFDNFEKVIEKRRNDYFDKLPLDKEDIATLNKLCLYLLTKDRILPIHSGIVFVGYGDTDLLPSCCAYIFESLICGKLKYQIDNDKSLKIEFTGSSAAVIPFGQDDIVQNFLLGAHPVFLDVLNDSLINGLKVKEAVAENFMDNLTDKMVKSYTASIISAVRALPKEDLAIMAETLVNLTSFMRKVSISLESVGGPVDVAVISKQDGFIWIKRKHYFDAQDNLHWHHSS
jgi:hypothetical protein